MGIEYYAFALFLTGLICFIAIICKLLFSNAKKQRALLDEKEAKLLQLYGTVNGAMEDFNDQLCAATDEIREYMDNVSLLAALSVTPPPKQKEEELPELKKLPPPSGYNQNMLPSAREATTGAEKTETSGARSLRDIQMKEDNGHEFKRFLDDATVRSYTTEPETSARQTRNEAVLTLAAQGKSDVQIAGELEITQNEVRLIVGLASAKY
ncbi:MAG: hypothetical protein FWH57_01500 [Oscillospiraceae bacterium]|nr:hypothetical protein [Oscillospiraceae bacterium]